MIQSDKETYGCEPFTRHAFCQEVNRVLVQRTIDALTPAQGRPTTIVDLGCGTGAATNWLLVVARCAERDGPG